MKTETSLGLTTMQLLANAAGAEFEDSDAALTILEELIRKTKEAVNTTGIDRNQCATQMMQALIQKLYFQTVWGGGYTFNTDYTLIAKEAFKITDSLIEESKKKEPE